MRLSENSGHSLLAPELRKKQNHYRLRQFRCPVDIIGMTTSEKVWRKLNLSWGVTPVLCEEFSSMEVMFYHAMKKAKEVFSLQSGDAVVLTGGLINGKVGNTNVIKVETVK